MTAALGTLVFLTMMWLLVLVGAAVLEESGAKIAAALKGNSAINPVQTMPVRMRIRPRLRPSGKRLKLCAGMQPSRWPI